MDDFTLYIGADHRGFERKNALIEPLSYHDFVKVEDCGALSLNPGDDFNDPAIVVARKVLANEYSKGILICGSAHGVCMQANRFRGIRAINATTPESARKGVEDDYANVICLSADQLSLEEMVEIIKEFCHAQPKTEEKYVRRMRRLDEEVN